MASPGGESQPTWIPYETIKDCSQGFCSIYCPQWCYIIFPPPPPPGLSSSSSSEDPSSSSSAGAALSPLVIAVIGILASALLLVAYYAVICKYCTRIDALRRRLQGRDASSSPGRDVDAPGPWYAPAAAASGGLDEGAIKSIGQFRYRTGEGPVEEGGDCSVCLGEFRDGEGLRLLPKCGHAFHVACIDHWLRSHASCPLCRAAVVSPCAAAALPPLPPPTAPPEQPTGTPTPESPQDAIVADDVAESGSRDGEASGHGGLEQAPPVAKSGALNRGDVVLEFGDCDGAQPIRRSFSMGASRLSRVCVADVLVETAVDEEDMGSTSKGCCRTRQDASQEDDRAPRRPQYPAAGPGAMKRSFSSGRFCWQGKVSHGGSHESILPI